LNPLLEIIGRETRQYGVISFARFMELALYCPVYGYYEKEKDNVGRRGDFFTSVSVGKLFGELLAFQFSEWLETLAAPEERLQIVEAGAHNGKLTKDILTWLSEKRTTLFHDVDYWIIEPSERRRRWQQELLCEFAGKVRWCQKISGVADRSEPIADRVAASGVHGIIFSNELLDAMPVHRLGWDATRKVWFEWGVRFDAEKFVWEKILSAHNTARAPELPDELLNVLPDGFTTEICIAAETWWREAAMSLKRGKLLTFDYGLDGLDFLRPERSDGSLRAYHRHHLVEDVLANVGEQDLTTHVNFSAIQAVGESAGLRTLVYQTQEEFLTSIAAQLVKDSKSSGDWSPRRTRQFQTLTHPEHLGRSFRVLAQLRR
jgi:SAM-dependent MidA family methyltransferase